MASVKLLDPNDPKNRLERYELIGEIAAGGMAVVYLARIAGMGGFQRFVAIKKLHEHLAREQEFVEMFLDEARLAAGIHNPHVVPILEVGGSDGGYYLVMEYIEGDTLARVASRAAGRATGLHAAATAGAIGRPKRAPASMPTGGPAIPRPVTVRMLLDSLAGLHAAHELTDPHGNPLQIVHRDISPQNILVGVDGSTRITDFGVARAAARLSTTRSDTVKGKLAYLSPEQARGETCDRRTDLFAMGIILWEMLTGRRLFRGETDHETLARVMSGTIPPPSSIVPGMHPAFDAVVLKALARDISQRFSTCAEMGDALERAAMDAAATGADGGVASPRDVAAFMNTVLGQEIAAQRESVRVWLSQRNDPSLAASRPAAPRAILATGVQSIVAPMTAPPRPPGMTSSPPPAKEAFAPVVNAPHPEDGDPTTLRLVSSLTNASISVRNKPHSEPPLAGRVQDGAHRGDRRCGGAARDRRRGAGQVGRRLARGRRLGGRGGEHHGLCRRDDGARDDGSCHDRRDDDDERCAVHSHDSGAGAAARRHRHGDACGARRRRPQGQREVEAFHEGVVGSGHHRRRHSSPASHHKAAGRRPVQPLQVARRRQSGVWRAR
jgi:serine/threonine protein kinase